MTRLLASVRDPVEARLALDHGADIIDLKEPAAGALGAVPPQVQAEVLRVVKGQRKVSATIGDLPLHPAAITQAVAATWAAGVDYVKMGLFEGDFASCLDALRPLLTSGVRLVAVLFADQAPDWRNLLPRLQETGFAGAMIDTADKGAGRLTSHLSVEELAAFVKACKGSGLMTGLAGSLRLDDIPVLAPLGADYLGFRGALCAEGRAGKLSPAALNRVSLKIAAYR